MTTFSKPLKSGFTAAFFILYVLISLSINAQVLDERIDWSQVHKKINAQKLPDNRVWHALLHLDQGQPQIKTSGFLLAQSNFSTHQELLSTLTYLYGGNQQAVCRFPARYLWLQEQLQLPELPVSGCNEINEFIEKAPFDELTLVFATESVTQPASMMGHTFLKISGLNTEGVMLEHAVSYYTDANSINLPKLLWESIVVGKKGIFSLTPYERESEKYIDKEHRNLWEYKLRTTATQRSLIRNHFFELKQTELTYFLHSYNCATVLQNILGLTGVLQQAGAGWSTPKDVIRQAYQSDLIESINTFVADRWTYAYLKREQGARHKRSSDLLLTTTSEQAFEINSSRQQHFLTALNNVLLERQDISTELWKKNQHQLARQAAVIPAEPLQMDNLLNPAVSQGDSSLGLSFVSHAQGTSRLIDFLPASHRLTDKHHHQLAETEVHLFSGAVEITPKNTLALNQFNILSIKSLNPWNRVLKPISSQVTIGYGALTRHPDDPKSLHAHGAAGITQRLTPQLDVSVLLGAGVQTKPKAFLWFISSEFLTIYRATPNTKTLLSFRHRHTTHEQIRNIHIKQMLFVNAEISVWADMDVTQKSNIQRHTMGLGIQKNF